jgi:hypothetical protein
MVSRPVSLEFWRAWDLRLAAAASNLQKCGKERAGQSRATADCVALKHDNCLLLFLFHSYNNTTATSPVTHARPNASSPTCSTELLSLIKCLISLSAAPSRDCANFVSASGSAKQHFTTTRPSRISAFLPCQVSRIHLHSHINRFSRPQTPLSSLYRRRNRL